MNTMSERGIRLETAITIAVSDPAIIRKLDDRNPIFKDEKQEIKFKILKALMKKDLVVKKTIEFYKAREFQ